MWMVVGVVMATVAQAVVEDIDTDDATTQAQWEMEKIVQDHTGSFATLQDVLVQLDLERQ